MKIKSKITVFLFLIIILAAVLRLVNLSNVPPHLTADEASLGYNAYSILKTGRDEYGTLFPIIFKSFGDFKPGLYVYAAIPSVLIFGLNEFAVRLPSAIAGILAVVLLYLVLKEVWKEEKLALLGAFLLAINSWHIHFSRGAWEINLSLTLTLIGIYFFFKSFKKGKYLIFSAVFFALTLTAYQGAKLSTGIVVLLLLVLYLKELLKIERKVILQSIAVGVLVCIPIILSLFNGQTGRLAIFSVFSNPRPEKYLQDFLDEGQEVKGSLSYYLFHPEWLNFARGVLGRFFNHFSVRFLFFEGDWTNPRHSPPNMGMFLVSDAFLVAVGFAAMVKGKLSKALPTSLIKKENLFVGLWLILATLPSILSRDQVHAVRAFNMVIPFVIIMAHGAYLLISRYRIIFVALALIYTANYVYYLDSYFVHLPKHDSIYWEYGYKQIVEAVYPVQGNYKKIKVEQSYAQPYIYFLFFEKYDPAKYQAQAHLTESPMGDVGLVEKLDNIEFSAIDWSADQGHKGELIVADPIKMPVQDSSDPNRFKLIKEIKYLDGKTAFRVVEILK
ncbi:MAG TPA: phospholipid carrier-dependent glycosyltransferase [Patescibacteria group bacterium]